MTIVFVEISYREFFFLESAVLTPRAMCNSQFSLFGGLTMETIKKEQLLKIKKNRVCF